MKKLEKNITNYHPPVRIYLEDVKELESIFKNNFDKYTIKDGEYEYKDLNELIDQSKFRLNCLEFSGEDKSEGSNHYVPRLELKLLKSVSRLYLYNVDDKVEGIIARLEKIINSRARVCPLFTTATFIKKILFPYLIIGGIIIMATGKEISKNGDLIYQPNPIILFPILAVFSLMFLYLNVRMNKNAIIKLISKDKEQSFYRRNKDQIWLSIMSAIIGGIITFAIFYFTKNV